MTYCPAVVHDGGHVVGNVVRLHIGSPFPEVEVIVGICEFDIFSDNWDVRVSVMLLLLVK